MPLEEVLLVWYNHMGGMFLVYLEMLESFYMGNSLSAEHVMLQGDATV